MARVAARLESLILALALILPTSSAFAVERIYRRFDHRNGLRNAHITALCQDEEGFVWIGMLDELLRFDGREFRRWNRRKLNKVARLDCHPELGTLALEESGGRVYRAMADGLEPVFEELGPIRWMDVGGDGTVWLVDDGGTLHAREASGRWRSYGSEAFDGKSPWLVAGSDNGGAYVTTVGGRLWHMHTDGRATSILEGWSGGKRVAEHPNGALYVTTRDPSALLEINNGVVSTVYEWEGRPVDVIVRGNDVWFSSERLYRYPPGGSVEVFEPSRAVPNGAYLMVDREGSLWAGGIAGLVQYPEPGTIALANAGPDRTPSWRAAARTAEGVWMGYWSGLGLLRDGAPIPSEVEILYSGHFERHLCVDRAGRLWTFEGGAVGDERSTAGILERSGGRFRHHPTAVTWNGGCVPAGDGTVWFWVDDLLYRTPAESGVPAPVARLPAVPRTMAEFDGRLWLHDGTRLWHDALASLEDPEAWHNEDVSMTGDPECIYRMPSGALWIAGVGGLFRRAGKGWEHVPGVPRRAYYGIFPSPQGGFWLTSTGPALRVAERPDLPAGVEILETLTVWQGTTMPWNKELMEDPDGTIWITAGRSYLYMPPSARFAARPVPNVALVDARVDGKRVSLREDLELPYEKNRLELSFAALSYRDPSLIRYRVRSQPGDAWTETSAPSFRFTDLAPGTYHPQVIASLDEEHWSPTPASLTFRVLPPWYRAWWAYGLFAVLIVGLLYAGYRARVAFLLRLERQRARIAMDLHDEMGAGLGSIGILASLISDRGVDDEERRGIAEKIALSAEEMGTGLRDILWSLRTPARDLEALASYLAERAGRLFPGNPVRFTTAFPDRWPRGSLSLPVRRNLQLIALEALHNAAKHAQAGNVELGFEVSGSRWRMWIADDGKGLPEVTESAVGHGIGLGAMKARAEQIGAEIRWTAPDGGTRVEVTFRPHAEDRRVRRRLR